MPRNPEGKVAIVTGAAHGIGFAIDESTFCSGTGLVLDGGLDAGLF
ncbi:hypothetical protein ACIG56_23925 [Nocardia fusca]